MKMITEPSIIEFIREYGIFRYHSPDHDVYEINGRCVAIEV